MKTLRLKKEEFKNDRFQSKKDREKRRKALKCKSNTKDTDDSNKQIKILITIPYVNITSEELVDMDCLAKTRNMALIKAPVCIHKHA